MFYTANMKFKTKLVTYQHGFGYGIFESLYTDHEYNIWCFFYLAGKKTKNSKTGINRIFSRNKNANKIYLYIELIKDFQLMKNIIMMNLIG